MIVWMACRCHCWPIAAVSKIAPCGACGALPLDRCAEPEDGKAYLLTPSTVL